MDPRNWQARSKAALGRHKVITFKLPIDEAVALERHAAKKRTTVSDCCRQAARMLFKDSEHGSGAHG